jgi:S-DNA-T family DNA segregation ATPase FtsK/SpoIIIE
MNPHVAFVPAGRDDRARRWDRLLGALVEASPGDSRPVVLVDDADGLTPDEEQLASRLVAAGCSVVATAGYSANLYAHCPLALPARSSGTGLMLAPRAPGDGDVFGVRVDVPGRVPPGRAVAIVDGTCIDVQLGHRAPVGLMAEDRPAELSREAPRTPAA